MKPFLIVEGKADVKFLKDLIRYWFSVTLTDNQIIPAEGWSNLKNLDAKIRANTDKGHQILVIFDGNSDCGLRRTELNAELTRMGLLAKIFLLPNDSDPGNLDFLLELIINKKHSEVFDCFDSYVECLKRKSSTYCVPDQKTKIFAFISALLSDKEKKKAKEENRDYLDREIWDTDCDKLQPLKKFLEPFFCSADTRQQSVRTQTKESI